MKTRFAVLFGSILLCLRLASAQQLVSASSRIDSNGAEVYEISLAFPAPPPEVLSTPGAPYSAEVVLEGWQIQPDGTRVELSQWLGREYRDSQGRTRSERRPFLGPNTPSAPLITEITDFVSGYRYVLEPQQKVAHRSALAQSGRASTLPAVRRNTRVATLDANGEVSVTSNESVSSASPPADSVHPVPKTLASLDPNASPADGPGSERIGVRVIDGVSVEGLRYTHSVPNGLSDNNRPRTSVSEVWTSPELKLAVLTKVSEAGISESTVSLKRLSRSEPDQRLFQIPGDYTIKDEVGEYRIHLTLVK